MRTLIVVVFFACGTQVHCMEAREIQVRRNNYHYQLTQGEEELRFRDSMTDLSLKKKKCNQHIWARLYRELERVLKTESASWGPESLVITLANKTNYYSRSSAVGQFFIDLPDTFKTAKIEEKLNCDRQ